MQWDTKLLHLMDEVTPNTTGLLYDPVCPSAKGSFLIRNDVTAKVDCKQLIMEQNGFFPLHYHLSTHSYKY